MGEINALEVEYKLKPELIILPTHYAPQFSRISRMQQTLTAYQEIMAPSVIKAQAGVPVLDQYLPLTIQSPTCPASKEYRVFLNLFIAGLLREARNNEEGRMGRMGPGVPIRGFSNS